jgi:hypothetical protein
MSRADNVSASSVRFTAGRNTRTLERWSSSSRHSVWRRFAPYLGTVLALSLFGGALYLLHRQVAAYDPEDVRKAITALSWQRIIAALGLTAASYILLISYDALALRHIHKTLPFRRVAQASGVFTLVWNFGSSLFISVSIVLLVRSTATNYSRMLEFINPFNAMLKEPASPAAWNIGTTSGLMRLTNEILRQASMIGYINAFYLLALTAAVAVPLVWLMRNRSVEP